MFKFKSPFVSIIMPIRSEADFIQRSLGAVLSQDYPSEYMEILVVDGMSTDCTREIVQRIADNGQILAVKSGEQNSTNQTSNENRKSSIVNYQSPIINCQSKIILLDNPAGIVPTALNIGLKHARGKIIIRVDGHCEIPPEYVRRCVELIENTNASCVGGALVTVGTSYKGQGIALAQSSFFGVGGVDFRQVRSEPGYVDTLAFGAYKREVFDKIGYFDEELVRNQDDEFNFRLIQSGGKIWLDPSLKIKYYPRSSLRKLWKQYSQYGFYKVRVIQKRGAVPSWRHLIPGTFVLALVFSLLLAVFSGQPLWALAVAGPYAGANLLASVWTTRKNWKVLPLLPVVFFILHASYGLGFLWGLWKWRKKWK